MIRMLVAFAALGSAAVTIQFTDRTADSGIRASMHGGTPEKHWIMEANGSGVAVFDYDNDGQMDVLLTNGASMEILQRILRSEPPIPRVDGVYLYRNLGEGKFADVTKIAGLSNPFWGTGANVADVDGDGWTDILLTNLGQDVLYKNRGNGTFVDVSRKAGLSSQTAWHTGSAFIDYDGDGDQDIYVAGYVKLSRLGIAGAAPVCRYLDLPVFCGPVSLVGEPDIFYRNNGNGQFTDATREAGLTDTDARFGFTVVAADFNGDRRPDLFVANDSGPNYLYLNTGKNGFTEAGLASGVAYNSDGKAQANMGVAVADYDNDGDLDILTTTFSEDYFPLFQQTSPGFYEEVSGVAGLVRTTSPLLGWACGFADMDNDGWRDLWIANGHVYPTIGKAGRTTYHQPVLVLPNANGSFAGPPIGLAQERTQSWRGGASGDFNNDGRPDLLLTPVEGELTFLQNRTASANHWIGLDVRGQGATIQVEGCGKKWFDTVRSGGSYLSANDPRRLFGLGSCRTVDRVAVEWPSGRTQTLRGPAADRYHVVQ